MKQGSSLTKQALRIFQLTIIALLYCFTTTGQVVKLSVVDFCPRVGDNLEISYSVVTDTFDVASTNEKELLKKTNEKELGMGQLDFTNFIKDTGSHVFGPFIFTVDGHNVQSGTIAIHFDNALPNVNNGIWMRQLTYKEEEYLIIEQRIPGKWITTKTSATSSNLSFQMESEDYAELDENKIDYNTIYFQSSHSQSTSRQVEINGEEETVGYKISFYKIQKTNSFKAPFKLNKNNLKNLPTAQASFEFLIR